MSEDNDEARLKIQREIDLEWATSRMLGQFYPEEVRRIIRLKVQAYPFLCERQFDRVIQILLSDPELRSHPYCLSALAHVLKVAERWNALVPIRLRLMEIWSDCPDSWTELADAVFKCDGPAAALKVLLDGAVTIPDDPDYHLEICRVACLSGDVETARKAAQVYHKAMPVFANLFFSFPEFEPIWPDYPEARAFRGGMESAPVEEPPRPSRPEFGFLL